jgi:hypothetical protein
MDWAGALRNTLREHAFAWAGAHRLSHYSNRGQPPTILFERAADGGSHGNFHPDAWRAILAEPTWITRLDKPHSQVRALPPEKAVSARELDSSNSSDALLMNCFCFPGAADRIFAALRIATGTDRHPQFGFKARLPLADGSDDATEIDMRVGSTLFEAKLTEKDFTSSPSAHVLRYSDLATHFDVSTLLSEGAEIRGYQLIRNVLAAAHHDTDLIVLLDQRRPDLLEEWWRVHSAIKSISLRLRCGFRTWQQVAAASPVPLAEFLSSKYGL